MTDSHFSKQIPSFKTVVECVMLHFIRFVLAKILNRPEEDNSKLHSSSRYSSVCCLRPQ